MRFVVTETGDEVVAKQRPVVIITSNNEKELPDAFLRRCVFHFIDFPDAGADEAHRPRAPPERSTTTLVDQAVVAFYELRDGPAPAQAPLDERARRLDRAS